MKHQDNKCREKAEGGRAAGKPGVITVRVTNHPRVLRIVGVSGLKVLHPEKPPSWANHEKSFYSKIFS